VLLQSPETGESVMLNCELCGHPIRDKEVEWVNYNGEQKPFHTGDRYDPTTCAYIARHTKEFKDREFYVQRLLQDEFMR